MNIPRAAWIGGGILAFALAVFAMVPPTKPLGGATIDPGAHHGLADLPVPKPRPVVRQQPAVQQAAAPAPEGFSDNAADVAAGSGEDIDDGDEPSVNAASPRLSQAMIGARYALRDEYGGPNADQREYRAGYRWAADRDVDDPRQCRAYEGTARGDGCFAYLRDADDHDAGGRGRR